MNIDTAAIRRLRDGLRESGSGPRPDNAQVPSPDHRDALISRFSPFAETMYLVMAADGHEADHEMEVIRGALNILTDHGLDDASLDDILARCKLVATEHSVEGRLQWLGARLAGDRLDRETAFSLAAAVAMADEQVMVTEIDLISSIAEWYGISSRRSQELLVQLGN